MNAMRALPGMPAKANPEDVVADPEDEAVLREIRACVPSLCCEGGWWPEELEPKMWNGVQFGGGLYPTLGDETRVYRLDLSQGMCVGAETLPWEVIAKLPRLRKLWLNGNRLKRVGMEIGTCPTLEDLNLADNQLEGSDALPWELGDIASLQKLKLDGNETLGFLPSSIAKLTSLSDLNLADCGLERINPMLGRETWWRWITCASGITSSNRGGCRRSGRLAGRSKKMEASSTATKATFLWTGRLRTCRRRRSSALLN